MKCWKIQIEGRVQGIGFRPFIYKLAVRLGVQGWVQNTISGVWIEAEAPINILKNFCQAIQEEAPPLARIISFQVKQVADKFYSGFSIVQSEATEQAGIWLSPDFGMCRACLEEVKDPENRRYSYAFTSCTQCGPRYSIIESLPYDRPYTKMAPFSMCATCQAEFNHPHDRRFHSQINSCPDCAIELRLFHHAEEIVFQNDVVIFNILVEALEKGKTIAMKGIGGYLLLGDASQLNPILALRALKQRPFKPFALMCADVDMARQYFHIDETQSAWLQGEKAPILLLEPLAGTSLQLAQIAPGLRNIGVMLAYTPLAYLLVSRFGKPLIATSGNLKGAPILYQDAAQEQLGSGTEYLLTHNRDILIPQDDSVMIVSKQQKQHILLRRARGWAPMYEHRHINLGLACSLAMGADLKATFCFAAGNRIFHSQYFGDMMHPEVLNRYSQVLEHVITLTQSEPARILTDLHPGYQTSLLGQELAAKYQVPIHNIQHHEAHFAALLGEHELWESGPVLGIIWDGTGLGYDRMVWGGEFYLWEGAEMKRINHLAYFPVLGGDQMALKCGLSALALSHHLPAMIPLLKPRFTQEEWNVYQQLLSRPGRQSSSMGRLFDAVASWLNICQVNHYEGQAPALLEEAARSHIRKNGMKGEAFPLPSMDHHGLNLDSWFLSIQEAVVQGTPPEQVAYQFHFSLVNLISHMASRLGVNRLGFSGGVFQNSLLVDLLHIHLKSDYTLFFHEALSPNDENISFGQLMHTHFVRKH